MWQVIWRRLGAAYLLLLPTLIAVGFAMDAGVQAFCYHLHSPLEEATGRGIAEQGGLIRVLEWIWHSPGSLVFAAMIPWWIGAWVMLRPKEALTFPAQLQVVFSVIGIVVAQLAFLLGCFATVLRALQLWSMSSSGPLSYGLMGIMLVFVVLSFISTSRLSDR